MRVKMNTWFKLPWLGGEIFPQLRAARVDYMKGQGFRFTSSTNLERAIAIISEATGEPLEVEGNGKQGKQCFICGEFIAEIEGELERTICDKCMESEDAYSLYVLKFQELMDAI